MNLSKNCKTFLDKPPKNQKGVFIHNDRKHINNYTTQPNNWTKQLKIHICLYTERLPLNNFAI